MKKLSNVEDVELLVTDSKLKNWIYGMNDQLAEDLDEDDAQEFVVYFGGDIFLVENEQDLKEIDLPYDGSNVDRNITEGAAVFDIAEWILGGMYAQLMLITNNGGGNTYVIPRVVAGKSENVIESMKMTQKSYEKETENLYGDPQKEKLEEDAKDIEQEMKSSLKEYDDPMSDEMELGPEDKL